VSISSRGATRSVATEFEIRDAIANLRFALINGPRLPNIWVFFSHKNHQLLTLLGDITFMQAVLLEGDPNVFEYQIGKPSFAEDEQHSYGRDLIVQYRDNKFCWYFCGRHLNLIDAVSPSMAKRIRQTKSDASNIGAEFHIRTEVDLQRNSIEFHNWLRLCAARTRSRDFSTEADLLSVMAVVEKHRGVSIGALLSSGLSEPALVIAAIARGLANGYLHCDLKHVLLDSDSVIYPTPGSEKSSVSTVDAEMVTARSQLETRRLVPLNRRTARIAEAWRDLEKWPIPRQDLLRYPDSYDKNKLAIEMYLAGRSSESIYQETGLKPGWVRKLFNRCLSLHADGRILGFRALVRYGKDARSTYHRTLPTPTENSFIGKKSGYSGAMLQLLERFSDDLIDIIQAHVLKLRAKLKSNHLHESRIGWSDLKADVFTYLKNQGLGENDYPFNTRDKWNSSLASLGRSILFNNPHQFIRARHGKGAADRSRIGSGIPSLIQATGAFEIVELDFHKHDSEAVVDIKTPKGNIIPCNIPRWWIGALVDTWDRAILGTSDSFEAQTTASCVLELIDSALGPPISSDSLRQFKGCEDGFWLPNQLLPAFAFQGFDVVKMDRAWAHYSTNVISSLVATTGCAVSFSKPHSWWARSIVERTFGELTRRGAQRLPTTTGSGPSDTRRDKPEKEAVRLHFSQTELCDLARSEVRAINAKAKDGNFFESALNFLRRTAATSSFLPRPLPEARHNDRPSQWIRLPIKVEANPEKGVAPHVRTHHCRFSGAELSKAWALQGQIVVLEINRHDIRIARVLQDQTGVFIGKVIPERKWMLHRVGWRNFLMIQKYGRYYAGSELSEDPVTDFLDKKSEEIEHRKRKAGVKGLKQAAQQHASLEHDMTSPAPLTIDSTNIPKREKRTENDADKPPSIKLTPAPKISSFSR